MQFGHVRSSANRKRFLNSGRNFSKKAETYKTWRYNDRQILDLALIKEHISIFFQIMPKYLLTPKQNTAKKDHLQDTGRERCEP